jgi:tetratricopeptide (TPR) repeat protein
LKSILGRGDFGKAEAVEVLAIDSGNLDATRLLATAELRSGSIRKAIDVLTRAIDRSHSPDDVLNRANCYARLGQAAPALNDLDELLKKKARGTAPYLLKAEVLRQSGRSAEVPALADAMVQAYPDSVDAVLDAARLLAASGERSRARTLLDSRLPAAAAADLYVMRAVVRDDQSGKIADLQKALEIKPKSEVLAHIVATALLLNGLNDEALGTINLMETWGIAPAITLNLRGIAQWKRGEQIAARAAFAAARQAATEATTLSGLCEDKAIHRVELEQALQECDAALKQSAYGPIAERRAHVLAQMDRLEDAELAYTAALQQRFGEGASALYGRGSVRLRRGDKQRGEEDIRLARIISPQAVMTIQLLGVTP